MLEKGTKSKDGNHEWTRETLQSLHDKGNTDAEIAAMFGTSAAIVSFARKRKQLWETAPIEESAEDQQSGQESPPKNRGGRPRKIQETENSQNEVE